MNRTVTIGGIGAHGDYTEKIEVDESIIWDRARIEATLGEAYAYPKMMISVDDKIIHKLNKKACPAKGCTCGSGPEIWGEDGDRYLIECKKA